MRRGRRRAGNPDNTEADAKGGVCDYVTDDPTAFRQSSVMTCTPFLPGGGDARSQGHPEHC